MRYLFTGSVLYDFTLLQIPFEKVEDLKSDPRLHLFHNRPDFVRYELRPIHQLVAVNKSSPDAEEELHILGTVEPIGPRE